MIDFDKFNMQFPPGKIKRSMKKKYAVYNRFRIESESIENNVVHDWQFIGETYAKSKAQAINNVRHNYMGDVSQYKPLEVSGHWDSWLDWKAEVIT